MHFASYGHDVACTFIQLVSSNCCKLMTPTYCNIKAKLAGQPNQGFTAAHLLPECALRAQGTSVHVDFQRLCTLCSPCHHSLANHWPTPEFAQITAANAQHYNECIGLFACQAQYPLSMYCLICHGDLQAVWLARNHLYVCQAFSCRVSQPCNNHSTLCHTSIQYVQSPMVRNSPSFQP